MNTPCFHQATASWPPVPPGPSFPGTVYHTHRLQCKIKVGHQISTWGGHQDLRLSSSLMHPRHLDRPTPGTRQALRINGREVNLSLLLEPKLQATGTVLFIPEASQPRQMPGTWWTLNGCLLNEWNEWMFICWVNCKFMYVWQRSGKRAPWRHMFPCGFPGNLLKMVFERRSTLFFPKTL